MFNLYYLVDQSGDIAGDKTFAGDFDSIALAQQQALTDGVSHFSVEFDNGSGFAIVYII